MTMARPLPSESARRCRSTSATWALVASKPSARTANAVPSGRRPGRIFKGDEIDRPRHDRGRLLEVGRGLAKPKVGDDEDRRYDHACGEGREEDRAARLNGEMILAERDRIAGAEPRRA